ncbi:MAG: phosphoglycerate dehydrogenase [Clostridia bacterium]|nr:phosphoglycerate dehydrogenase [Clostridia bacterium]
MYKIKTLNPISDIVKKYLPQSNYSISDAEESPEGILVRSASMHEYKKNDNLLCVARAGAGYNNIPYDEYAQSGIVVFNTPGANANGVKELVICGMLLSARGIYDGIAWTQQLKGSENVAKAVEKGKKDFAGSEISGKKLGIIGIGAIGAMVANAAVALDMDVTGYDPFMTVEAALSLSRSVNRGISLDEIYSESDFISLHVPLLDKTKGMINKQTINKCKDGVVILNFARGELVDTKAVIEALESGKIAKYVTDFPSEELLDVKNVISIPHLGASTKESEENCAEMAAKQIKDYLEDGNIRNSVNYPDCSQPRSGEYRLAILHKNVTNMVGQITQKLADENHNISNMINKSRDALAYTILDLDDSPSRECVSALEQIDGIIKVRSL